LPAARFSYLLWALRSGVRRKRFPYLKNASVGVRVSEARKKLDFKVVLEGKTRERRKCVWVFLLFLGFFERLRWVG
jgi:hypothetical protein